MVEDFRSTLQIMKNAVNNKVEGNKISVLHLTF